MKTTGSINSNQFIEEKSPEYVPSEEYIPKLTDLINVSVVQEISPVCVPQTNQKQSNNEIAKVNAANFNHETSPGLVLLSKDNVMKANQRGLKRTLRDISQNDDVAPNENIAPKKERKSEKRPTPSIRFDYSLGHFPIIDKSRKVRCKYEGCPNTNFKSYVSCSICNVHLCFCVEADRNCFTDFHKIKK